MPKPGDTYKITSEWQEDVRAELKRRNTTPTAFAKEYGISVTSMHDMLAENAKRSAYVPLVNKALGWPIPAPFLTNDELEALEQYRRLDDIGKGRMLEMLRAKANELEQRRRKR